MNWFALLSVIFSFSLFFLPMAHASDIDTSNVTIELIPGRNAKIILDTNFTKVTTNKISYIVFADVISVKGYDALGPINCKLAKRAYGTEVVCDPSISEIISQDIDSYPIHLEMLASDLVSEKHPEESIFSFTYPVTSPTKRLKVVASLPEGTILLDTGDVKPYFPANANIRTTGRQVVLEWSIDKPTLGESYIFRAQFESLGEKVQKYTFFAAVLLGTLLAVAIIAFIIYSVRKKMAGAPLIRTVFSVLRADERKVLDILVALGGSCKQRDIVKKTDFSKAKVSRIIADLEKRGILEKDRTGRTNKIVLRDPTQSPEKVSPSPPPTETKEEEKTRFGI